MRYDMKRFLSLFLALVLCMALLPPSAQAAAVYSPWFKSSFLEMDALGILPDAFRSLDLTASVTRREMCELAVPALESITGNVLEKPDTTRFSDCSDPAVCKACELGIVDGYPDGTFRPDRLLSRQECFSVVTKFCLAASMQPVSEGADLSVFSDAQSVAAWAEQAVRVCVRYQFVQGASDRDGKLWLKPTSDLSRQEAMAVFLRCYKGLSEYYYYVRSAQVVSLSAGGGNTVVLGGVTVTERETVLYTDVDLLNVRCAPTLEAEAVGSLTLGEKAEITGVCSNGWARIRFAGGEAYVMAKYLAEKPESGAAPQVASSLALMLCEDAMAFLGYPYVWGGTSPASGFDCSGLVYYVFTGRGIAMNRVADDQMEQGVYIPKAELLAGDLVFFGYGDYADHVGIYIGNGNFLHAANPSSGVKISSMNETYYLNKYIGARRVV